MGGEGAQTRISIRIGISDRPPTAVASPSAQGLGNAGNSMHSLAAPSVNGGRQSSYDYTPSALSTVEEKRHKRKSSMGIPLRNSSYSQAPGGAGASATGQHHRHSLLSGSAGAAVGDFHSWSWEVWDCIRNICGYHRRLSLSTFYICILVAIR
jgi:protein arginine N-methyltransferase 5